MANAAAITNWTLELLNGNSSRWAELKTNNRVSYSTIDRLKKGHQIDVQLFIILAETFKRDVIESLRICGYDEMVRILENHGHGIAEGNYIREELTREEVYDDLPPELRQVVGMHTRVVNALPPGRQRDIYIAGLEAQAEANWALLEARDKAEEEEENKKP